MKNFLFVLAMGFALFAMHFGAGNLFVPLVLGIKSEGHWLASFAGLLLTAVGVPMVGFLAIMKLQGSTRAFFNAFGSWLGLLLMTTIVALIGPFGGLARCVAFTHQIVCQLVPVSLPLFCALSCCVLFLMTLRKSRLVGLLGKVLTPLLLVVVATILCVGVYQATVEPTTLENSAQFFSTGLFEGYQTMDLLAALFFSAILFQPIDRYVKEENSSLSAMKIACGAALVAGALLSVTYVGFGFLAVSYREALLNVTPELLLFTVSKILLGNWGAYLVAVLTVLACFTTAIALATTFATFVEEELVNKKIEYKTSLAFTFVVTFFMATMSFSGIVATLAPVLEISYPVLIALSLYNLLRKIKVHSILVGSEV